MKLGHAVTLLKYLASVMSIFLEKTLIWNKIKFSASNMVNIRQLVVLRVSTKKVPIFLFLFDLSLLNLKISRD